MSRFVRRTRYTLDRLRDQAGQRERKRRQQLAGALTDMHRVEREQLRKEEERRQERLSASGALMESALSSMSRGISAVRKRRQQDVAEAFSPDRVRAVEAQAGAFRGRTPQQTRRDLGADRARQFAEQVTEENAPQLRAVAQGLEDEGLAADDIVTLARRASFGDTEASRQMERVWRGAEAAKRSEDARQSLADNTQAIGEAAERRYADDPEVRRLKRQIASGDLSAGERSMVEQLLRERTTKIAGEVIDERVPGVGVRGLASNIATGIIEIDQDLVDLQRPVTEPIGRAVGEAAAEIAVLPAQPLRLVGEEYDVPGLRSIPSQEEAAEAVGPIAAEIGAQGLALQNLIPLPIVDPLAAKALGLAGRGVARVTPEFARRAAARAAQLAADAGRPRAERIALAQASETITDAVERTAVPEPAVRAADEAVPEPPRVPEPEVPRVGEGTQELVPTGRVRGNIAGEEFDSGPPLRDAAQRNLEAGNEFELERQYAALNDNELQRVWDEALPGSNEVHAAAVELGRRKIDPFENSAARGALVPEIGGTRRRGAAEGTVRRPDLFGSEGETFATEGELAGIRETQAGLPIGKGELPTETAGPLLQQGTTGNGAPRAQNFAQFLRERGTPNLDEMEHGLLSGNVSAPARKAAMQREQTRLTALAEAQQEFRQLVDSGAVVDPTGRYTRTGPVGQGTLPPEGSLDDLLRDIRMERELAQQAIADPATRRQAGGLAELRQRVAALDEEEALIRGWQERGVTSPAQQAAELRELEEALADASLRLEGRRAKVRGPAYGTAEAAEQELLQRSRRPAWQRRQMRGTELGREQIAAKGDALESLAARPGMPTADIEDVLPHIDPDARPAAVGGGTEAFASPLLPFAEVESQVVSQENPVLRALVVRSGVNPSVAAQTPLERATVAYWRQRVAAEQLSDVAVTAAVDVHAQRFTGLRPNIVIPQQGRRAGMVQNVRPREEGASRVWQDVYSRPDEYALTPGQRAEIDDYLRVVDEAEFLRVQAGLKPRATRGPQAAKEGWFYVPRQVQGIRGVELRRPSSPGLQRHYEEAADGIARGVRYDANPRATLELHVKQAYKEIVDKQFSDHLEELQAQAIQRGERLFVTPKELVPEPVAKRMADATTRRLAAERARRALTVSKALERVEPETAQRLRGRSARRQPPARGFEFQPGTMTAQQRAAQAELETARTEYQSAKNAYSKAMEAARRAEVAPGSKFGQEADTIPIKQWRNRFFPREDAERLQQGIEEFFKPIQQSPFVQGAMTVGNTIRFLASVGDFAEPFIQGQLVFGADPAVWARATVRHYQGFFDPTVQARIVREWLPEFQEMAAHGTPIGDQEFFAALREGGGPSAGKLLKILPHGKEARNLLQNAGRQTFGRFQASYNTGLASSRAGLTRSLRDAIPDAAQRQATIRNLTGGLDSRALGVGPAQRSVEGFVLAFSPRLLRSTVALVGDLRLGLRNPRGLAAYTSLATLTASATGLYVLSGLALGKTWEEIETGLDPLNGKKFFSHEVNGDWVGIGGQVRSIVQLMSRVAAPAGAAIKERDPSKLKGFGALIELDPFDNPLIAFYQSRGAPALGLVGGAVEATTGADLAPYDDIENLPDFVKHVGTSGLPFAIQGILEGENVSTTLAALVGGRTSAGTLSETFATLYREKYGTDPQAGVSPRTLDADLARQAGYSEETAFGRERRGLLEPDEGFLAEAARNVVRSPNTAMEGFADLLGDYFRTSAGVTAALIADLDLPEREGELAQQYYEIDPRDRLDPETNRPDWDYYESRRERILRQIAREDPNAARRLREGGNVRFSDTTLQEVYDAKQELGQGLDVYYETESDDREAFRRGHPDIDAQLYLMGRVSRVVSSEGREQVRRLSRRLLGVEVEPAAAERTGGFERSGVGGREFERSGVR